jgi:hypothetical protein
VLAGAGETSGGVPRRRNLPSQRPGDGLFLYLLFASIHDELNAVTLILEGVGG